MTLKDNWGTGDTYNADDMNALTTQVNENTAALTDTGLAGAGSPMEARAAIEASRAGKTVFVEDYRSGSLTDNEIIVAAFADLEAGGEIRFGQGVTYTTTADILIYLADRPNVLINGQGATIQSDTASTILFLAGSRITSTDTTLTAAVTSRTTTLTVADTTGVDLSGGTWAAGDMVTIFSDAEKFSLNSGSYDAKQEMGRVASVPDGTTIVLDSRTWNTYSISGYTVTVRRYNPMRNVSVRDLNIVGAGDGVTSQTALNLRYFDGASVSNVSVSDVRNVGIDAWEGMHFTATDCRAQDCGVFQGYGFHVSEVHAAKLIGCYGLRNRHSFDCHDARDLLYLGCTADNDTSAGISTHNADVVKVIDCTARECGGGIIIRGSRATIRNNHILGSRLSAESNGQTYRVGITVGNGGNTYDGNAGTDLVIEGNFIDLSGPAYAVGGEGDNIGQTHGILTNDPLIRARIENNSISGFPTHGIYAVGDTNTDVQISGNRLDCTSQIGGIDKVGIYFAPWQTDAANIQTDIRITGNHLTDGSTTGIYVEGASTTSPRCDGIRITGNRIGDCTTPIYFDLGYYGSDVAVYDNEVADDSAAVSLTANRFSAPPYVGNTGYGRSPRPLGVGQENGARMRPGFRYGPSGSIIATAVALDRINAVPLFVPRRVNVARIGIEVTTASGTAGSESRLAIYADLDDGYGGYPGALVAGSEVSVATDATGYVEGVIDAVLTPGLYWLAQCSQTAAPSLRCLVGSSQSVGVSSAALAGRTGFQSNASHTGSLPADFGAANPQGNMAYVQVQVSPTSYLT